MARITSKTLDDLFHDTLKDIYFAEKKILATLPKMAKAAQNGDLKAAFEKHRGETEEHVTRLEQVFGMIEKSPQGKTCAAIVGITDEGAEIMTEWGRRACRDRPLASVPPARGYSRPRGRRAQPEMPPRRYGNTTPWRSWRSPWPDAGRARGGRRTTRSWS